MKLKKLVKKVVKAPVQATVKTIIKPTQSTAQLVRTAVAKAPEPAAVVAAPVQAVQAVNASVARAAGGLAPMLPQARAQMIGKAVRRAVMSRANQRGQMLRAVSQYRGYAPRAAAFARRQRMARDAGGLAPMYAPAVKLQPSVLQWMGNPMPEVYTDQAQGPGDIITQGDVLNGLGKISLKKIKKVVSAPVKQLVQTVTHPVATVKADVKRVTTAFKGGNNLDPFAALASVASPGLRPLDAQLRAAGVKGGTAAPADAVNKAFAPLQRKLHDTEPVTKTLRKNIPLFRRVTDYTAQKPGTAVAAIVSGASLAAGAAGGGGAAAGAAAPAAEAGGGAAAGGGGGAAAAGGGLWDEAKRKARKAAKDKAKDEAVKLAQQQLQNALPLEQPGPLMPTPIQYAGPDEQPPEESQPAGKEAGLSPVTKYGLMAAGGIALLLLLQAARRQK